VTPQQELKTWAETAGFDFDDTIFNTHGGRECDVCGEPLCCTMGGEGMGEFDDDGDLVLAHATCGVERGLEVA